MNDLNYATLEASQRLVAAGIVLETEKYWGEYDFQLPRPSMAEVWRELPEGTDLTKGTFAGKNEQGITAAWCCLRKGEGAVTSPDIQRVNPADALIDLLIWVTRTK